MSTFIETIKKGNLSSGFATIGNIALASIKGIAAAISGSGAMFAEAMHSLADAVNQGFVFAGSILSERKPTQRFPSGFGRLINLFCMIAVIVVTIMAYETILEGWHLIKHPVGVKSLLLTVSVLGISIIVDGFILSKALKEIARETRTDSNGKLNILQTVKNVGRAAPPTRLVFYEDVVATSGALLALIAVLLSSITPYKTLDGIAAVLIGLMMLGAAFKIGYDNMVGLIGVAAPKEIECKIAEIIFSDPDVRDINKMRVMQEGRFYHAESYIELRAGLTLAEADDIKFRIRDRLLSDPDITDVTLGIIEDDGILNWNEKDSPCDVLH